MAAPPRLTRRTFTLSALGVGSTYALAACQDGGGHPAPTPQDPDAALIRAVLAAEEETLALCRKVAHTHRPLRHVLAQPERFHAQHVRLLEGGVTAPVKTHRLHVPPATAPALAAVVAAEHRLVREHAQWSMQARSGEVARLLAGLSAAAAQQAQVLGAVQPGNLP